MRNPGAVLGRHRFSGMSDIYAFPTDFFWGDTSQYKQEK